MIGKVVGQGIELTLDDDGVWESPVDYMTTMLNEQFRPFMDYGPSDGNSSIAALEDAAEKLGDGWTVVVDPDYQKQLDADAVANEDAVY